MTATVTEDTLAVKVERLEGILRSLGRVLVGYSGGIDSAMLAVAAHRVLGDDAVAVTAQSESYATGEMEAAAEICRQFGIRHEVIRTHELDNPDYARNPANRCYYCKTELFTQMQHVAARLGYQHVIYGQNADDATDFRPGAQAASERGARAPLAEAGITKADIRALAQQWGLPIWDRPAMACLSSRFPYGTPITAEGLRMVDRAELYLRQVCGFRQLRARHHGTICRLELPPAELGSLLAGETMRAGLVGHFRGLGYEQVVADLRGFRSGSMNEVLVQVDQPQGDRDAQTGRIVAELAPGAARWQQHDRMLCLQLAGDAIRRLADPEPRGRLVSGLEGLGLRYVAADLRALGQ
ncbi:MAG: ATP-dependent sacrificial sulfur transferase LarE [Candidatus Latescibacterota bacterium]